MRLRFLAAIFLLVLPALANAHKPSDSYLTLTGTEQQPLQLLWEVSLKDLELLVGVDADRDGKITWGELQARRTAVVDYTLAHLKIHANGKTCPATLNQMLVNRHSDGAYAVLDLTVGCASNVGKLTLDYSLLFDRDATHRGLVVYRNGGSSSTHVIKPGQAPLVIRAGERSAWATLVDFIVEGVWHIWIGFDHILFLLTLLFPAVMVWQSRKWQPVTGFRPAFFGILKIVTAFTLAHSITLWLAVMGYVNLPSRLVESLIALSILVTALNNLRSVLPLSLWVVAFAFGLIHGFGFASVLMDLGLADTSLALSLFGFNAGVELGQLAVVALIFPMAYMLRETAFYRWVVLRGGSLVAAVLAAIWFYERAFNRVVIGF